MSDKEILQRAVDYIEDNLKGELSAREVADFAGYSFHHFSRMFNNMIGTPVSEYITRRKLLHAVYEYNSKSAVEIAFDFGFNSYSGFYKAFRKEFGCSPRKYVRLCRAKRPEYFTVLKEARMTMKNNEIKQVLKNWDISVKEIKDISIMGGKKYADNVWNINGEYILKAGSDFSMLKKNIEISKEILKQNLNAGVPILTKDGYEFLEQGNIYFFLSAKIPGDTLSTDQRYDGDIPSIGREYGKGIAKLHLALQHIQPAIAIAEKNLYRQVTEWALPIAKQTMEQWELPLPDEFYSDYAKNFKTLYDKLPHQLIHRDTHAGNIIISDGLVSGFIDFDISEKNIRLFDPCYCATGILSEADRREDGYMKWPLFLKNILDGYGNVLPLTESEKAAVPYVIYSIQLICVAYFAGHDKYRELGVQNRKMLKWIWDNRELCFGHGDSERT